jgi:hypothetical protein
MPDKWAVWSCSQSQTSCWYSNDFLLNSSRAITNCFRMEACLELILASQCKSLFSTPAMSSVLSCIRVALSHDHHGKKAQILQSTTLTVWNLTLAGHDECLHPFSQNPDWQYAMLCMNIMPGCLVEIKKKVGLGLSPRYSGEIGYGLYGKPPISFCCYGGTWQHCLTSLERLASQRL